MFFDISRYLRDKYFDMVWGYHPLEDPQKSIFKMAWAEALVFFDISTFLRHKCFNIVWGITPADPPKMDPPKTNFLIGSN